jgi:hypothetical protein
MLRTEWREALSYDQRGFASRIDLSDFSSSSIFHRQDVRHRGRSSWVRGVIAMLRIRSWGLVLCCGDLRDRIRGLHRKSGVHGPLVSPPHLRERKRGSVPRLSGQPASVGVSASCDSQSVLVWPSFRKVCCPEDPARGIRRWLLAELLTHVSTWWT